MMNLIIAGVGGQGVNVLTRVVAEVCRAASYACQFTVHKGGAQTLGTVTGELRVWRQGEASILGAAIAPGKLDRLVALEPWEALRHLPLAHSQVRCWVETEPVPIYNERRVMPGSGPSSGPGSDMDALAQWRQIEQAILHTDAQLHWRNYRRDALAQSANAAMANFFAGQDCLSALELETTLDLQACFAETFFAAIKAAPIHHKLQQGVL